MLRRAQEGHVNRMQTGLACRQGTQGEMMQDHWRLGCQLYALKEHISAAQLAVGGLSCVQR